jgi:hypothetical protein
MRVSQENCIRAGSVTHILLVTISIAMTHGLGYAQVPVASRQATLPSSPIAHGMPRDNQLTSIHEPSDQEATRPCRLQVQDTFVKPPAKTTEAHAKLSRSDRGTDRDTNASDPIKTTFHYENGGVVVEANSPTEVFGTLKNVVHQFFR